MLKTIDERDDIEFERILAAKCKEIANNGDVKTGFCHILDCYACPMCGPDGCIDKEEIRSMAAKAWLFDHGFLKDDL